MRELLRQIQRTTALLAERLSSSQGTLARDVLPGTSSSSPMPPSHNLFPSLTTTPCYRTNSTRWRPYHSTSPSTSCQESSSREDRIQANLARLFQPYNSNPQSGGYKGKHLKRKCEIPWSHYFDCLSEPGSTFLPNLEDTRILEECGLGRKLITFSTDMASHSDLAIGMQRYHFFRSDPIRSRKF